MTAREARAGRKSAVQTQLRVSWWRVGSMTCMSLSPRVHNAYRGGQLDVLSHGLERLARLRQRLGQRNGQAAAGTKTRTTTHAHSVAES